jgi:putative transposase
MMIQRGYKTELRLNNKQRTLCLKSAGVARFTYNWGLRIKQEEYQTTGKSPTAIDLHKCLNVLKKTDFPWMYDVSKCAAQEALRNLDRAFENFFRRVKAGETPGYPKFKSKKRGVGSFRLTGSIRVTATHIQLPRLGKLRLKETRYLPTTAKILAATVSEKAGRWFVSVQVEEERPQPEANTTTCGVDVGISALATLDNGTQFENPKALSRLQERLKRLQKRVSRKVKGSQNRKKAVKKLARLHYRIACVRKDALHKATTTITKSYGVIGIEDLNVAGMVKNHHLAQAVSDASFAEFHRQLAYKARWQGGRVVKADRFFPSSKTCSGCGAKKNDLKLSDRLFVCTHCGLTLNRDVNAAINLKHYTVSFAGINACGDGKLRDAVASSARPRSRKKTPCRAYVLHG